MLRLMVDIPARRKMIDDERLLAERLSLGDEDAFDQVVRRYGPEVERLARRVLAWNAHSDAADVVQEVMLRVYLKRKTFRAQSSIKTWLMRITVNQCRSLQRRRVMGPKLFAWMLKKHQSGPDDLAIRDELASEVRKAVQNLNARDREVVVLHYLEQMPVDQVANIVGSSSGAVMVRMHRARKQLGEILGSPERVQNER